MFEAVKKFNRRVVSVSVRQRSGALCVVIPIVVGFLIRFHRLGDFNNNYYTATVKSMTQGWSNFFFGSFDPIGVVSVDKPPAAFWFQVPFGMVFGVNEWSVVIPQFILGIITIPVIYYAIVKPFGRFAATVAASIVAILPASVIIDTSNEPDALVAFCLLLSAVAIMKAAHHTDWRWLIIFAVCISIGFNSKMFVAYVPLPIFMGYLLMASKTKLKDTLIRIICTSIFILVLSFTWLSSVALTAEDNRPYVGSTQDNSIWTLTFDYNGLRRFGGFGGPPPNSIAGVTAVNPALPNQYTQNKADEPDNTDDITGLAPPCLPLSAPPGMALLPPQRPNLPPCPNDTTAFLDDSDRSLNILALLRPPLANQLGWLLPLGIILLVPVVATSFPAQGYESGRALISSFKQSESVNQGLLWSGWLVIALIIFGSANATHTHPYYLVAVTVPLAAVIGIGLSRLINGSRSSGYYAWLTVAVLITGLLSQVYGANEYVSEITLVCLTLVAFIGLILVGNGIVRGMRQERLTAYAIALTIGAFGFVPVNISWESEGKMVIPPRVGLIAPPYIANNIVPPAGSRVDGVTTNFPIRGDKSQFSEKIINYLHTDFDFSNGAAILATQRARDAAPFILADIDCIAIGGFSGSDPIFNVEKFNLFVNEEGVKYFFTGGDSNLPIRPTRQIIGDAGAGLQSGDVVAYVRSTWHDISHLADLPRGTLFSNPIQR